MNKKQHTNQTKTNTSEVDSLKNQLARALADYANLNKKVDEERMGMYKLVSTAFVSKLLPIIDNLKQAQNHVNDSGIAIIIGQLENLLKEEGFEEVKIIKGDVFDENTSEVVEVLESKAKEDDNKVSEVVLTGWKYKDGFTVRHARVKVFKYDQTEDKKSDSFSEKNN